MTDSDMQKLADGPSNSNNQLPLVLGIISVILAAIAIIIGAVSLSQNGTNNYQISSGPIGSSSSESDSVSDERIWTFAIGHEAAATEYLDEITGEIKGFDVDIVNAVCRIANKNCRWTEDIYSRCWTAVNGVQQGGIGLWDGYYDACTAWFNTYVRSRAFRFTDPFAKANNIAFIVLQGNPNGFDITNLNGKKIGFVTGWAYNPSCFNRVLSDYVQGGQITEGNIIEYRHREDFVEALRNREIDAGFDEDSPWKDVDDVDILLVEGSCQKAGRSIMTRKDNLLADWWNPAFEKLTASYEYKLICEDLNEQHGHISGPNPEDICFGYKAR